MHVIVEGQRNLLAAAQAAGVKRMIPSDFSADISRLDHEDNFNLGIRKKFHESFTNSSVAQTSVYCGGFLDVLLSPRFPTVDWEKGIVSYWGDGNQALDYTAISDVALYTATVALDPGTTGRPIRVAGTLSQRMNCTVHSNRLQEGPLKSGRWGLSSSFVF
jgi:nucleoside-diphosphate-sugar epimerase